MIICKSLQGSIDFFAIFVSIFEDEVSNLKYLTCQPSCTASSSDLRIALSQLINASNYLILWGTVNLHDSSLDISQRKELFDQIFDRRMCKMIFLFSSTFCCLNFSKLRNYSIIVILLDNNGYNKIK